jgi:nicotinamide-nucleotide amidase
MAARAELITIGDEILYGQTLDTNSHWISGELDALGIKVIRRTTIPDHEDIILKAFEEAQGRADMVLITGGLGPTNDDLTKPCLCKFFGTSLAMNNDVLDEIKTLFAHAGRELSELSKLQAMQPIGSKSISNRVGTAPGIWMERDNTVFISMPGVPHEMKTMMSERILPLLKDRFIKGHLRHKFLRTAGIPESRLAEKIKPWEDQLPSHIKLAYLPTLGQVKLRLTSSGMDAALVEKELEQEAERCRPLLEKYIYATENIELEHRVGQLLREQDKTLAIAESCTGGFLSHLITSIPGSSDYFMGSFVPYSNKMKEQLVHIKHETLREFGAVSEQVVLELAQNVRDVFGTSIGISISGIAGPTGGSEEKPVGTVWIAYADGEKQEAKKFVFTKDRKLNIQFSAMAALNMLRIQLE